MKTKRRKQKGGSWIDGYRFSDVKNEWKSTFKKFKKKYKMRKLQKFKKKQIGGGRIWNGFKNDYKLVKKAYKKKPKEEKDYIKAQFTRPWKNIQKRRRRSFW